MKLFVLALALASVEGHMTASYGHSAAYPTYRALGGQSIHGHNGHSVYSPLDVIYKPHIHNEQNRPSNPWGVGETTTTTAATTVVDKSNWFSPYSQYSPVRIPYVAANPLDTKYAKCIINSANPALTMQLAQRPGHATMVRTTLTATASTQYAFRIREYGLKTNACADQGDEYNPLLEKDALNRVNPYQDTTRGRIENVTTNASGVVTDFLDQDVLVNLSGPDSIIGRGITIYSVNATTGALTAVNCCVVGYDEPPTTDVVTTEHHHHAPVTGQLIYQGYQTHGHSHSPLTYSVPDVYGSHYRY